MNHSRARIQRVASLLCLTTALAVVGSNSTSDALSSNQRTSVALKAASSIKVMQYNIKRPNAEDTGIRAWNNRKDGVVDEIQTQNPAIIGVDEAKQVTGYGDPVNYLTSPAKLPGYSWVVPGNGKIIGYKSAAFTLVGNGAQSLPAYTCASQPQDAAREMTWARLSENATGRIFYVVAWHAAWGNCPAGRSADIPNLHAAMMSTKANGDVMIVMSDMNSDNDDHPGDTSLATMSEASGGTNHNYNLNPTAALSNSTPTFNSPKPLWDGSTANDSQRFDYIWISGNATASGYGIDTGKHGLTISPSDHYGIVSTIASSA